VLTPILSGDASGAGVTAGTVVTLTASATDTRYNQSNGVEPTQAIAAAEYTIDTPPWDAAAVPLPLAAADGSFNSTTEALTGSVTTGALNVGQHIVYVRARDAAGVWGPVSAVFLNVTPPPLPLPLVEVEPNNTLATAQLVTVFPSQISGYMSSPLRTERSDTDVFRMTLAPGATLRAELRPNLESDYNLDILDANGVAVASSALGTGAVDIASTSNTGAAPVTVYVRVTYASGLKGPTSTYTLLLLQ
jgi:hypothetical protein